MHAYDVRPEVRLLRASFDDNHERRSTEAGHIN